MLDNLKFFVSWSTLALLFFFSILNNYVFIKYFVTKLSINFSVAISLLYIDQPLPRWEETRDARLTMKKNFVF